VAEVEYFGFGGIVGGTFNVVTQWAGAVKIVVGVGVDDAGDAVAEVE